MWKVVISSVAEKRISRIPNPHKQRLLDALEALEGGLQGDIKPLVGRDEWRLRVGGWRVLMNVDVAAQLILVLYVDSRGDIYKHPHRQVK